MIGAYVVGTVLLVGGAVLLLLSKRESANAADRGPRQTAMERYQTDLLELRRQGAITEAQYHTRLLELRSLARPRAEEVITDDEFEAAAARLLDAKTDRPSAQSSAVAATSIREVSPTNCARSGNMSRAYAPLERLVGPFGGPAGSLYGRPLEAGQWG